MAFCESLNRHFVGNYKPFILLLSQMMHVKEARAILYLFCYSVVVFILLTTPYAKSLLRLAAKKRSFYLIVCKYARNLRAVIPYK